MTIACLGDSLTAGDYGVFGMRGQTNIKPQNYPNFLAEILGCETRNFGKCGYKASLYLQYYNDGNVNLDGAYLIVIMLGTNGGFDPASDTEENKCFGTLIERIKADAPNARLILCTPPHATSNPSFSNCGYAPQVEQAVEFVKKFAAENSLDLIDVASCPDFTAENEHIMQPNDGLHFGELGYKTLAEYIACEIKKITQ